MELEKLLKALGEPMRLKIFRQLLERKHCTRSLSKKLEISESAVSQHMKVLRESGLVYGERCGYHIHYFPSQEALDYMAETFAGMRQQSLDLDRDPNVCNCEFRRNQQECRKEGNQQECRKEGNQQECRKETKGRQQENRQKEAKDRREGTE